MWRYLLDTPQKNTVFPIYYLWKNKTPDKNQGFLNTKEIYCNS
jgi:hypothetical protein